jgi:hypothetical protein
MAVEVLACAVVAHRGPGVSMAGCDLDVAEVDAEHGGDVSVSEHVGMHPSLVTPALVARLRSRRVAECRDIRAPARFRRIGPSVRPWQARSTARATAGGRGRTASLSPLPTTVKTRCPWTSDRSATSAPVASKIRSPRSPSIATRAKSQGLVESRAAVRSAPNCRWLSPKVGESFETCGRRTYSARECSRTASMTRVR